MKYTKSEWFGFERLDFEFKGKKAIIVLPHCKSEGKWLLKTEYFGAFPELEIEMLNKGYHIAHVDNTTRWCLPEDTQRQAEFIDYISDEFSLNHKCVPVGMSCGGMQSVYLASAFPEKVAAIYIDAPVMNFLSCPFNIGKAQNDDQTEFINARELTLKDLINFRNHPIDHVDNLVMNRIPVALICGDSDIIVPYDENGLYLSMKYKKSDIPFFEVLKKGCNHHPHGLEDNTDLIKFIESVY